MQRGPNARGKYLDLIWQDVDKRGLGFWVDAISSFSDII
jgi:hypothetical protein